MDVALIYGGSDTTAGTLVGAISLLLNNRHLLKKAQEELDQKIHLVFDQRFLTNYAHIDFRGQNFELIPFGYGRRLCPGISFALQVLHLTLVCLLHAFDFATP
ncbi:hypothetical protein L6164_024711 [Bauhinia variegata]|uniref:Uncharacterized protein n=1 Tax=Bauhinia variegata TaxID=167791 RepID=A0ACB9LZB3_BAUVA|nr:hypothetical protein L6164_024711 [Bauhinia variegata]